jgi:hypothetical protein
MLVIESGQDRALREGIAMTPIADPAAPKHLEIADEVLRESRERIAQMRAREQALYHGARVHGRVDVRHLADSLTVNLENATVTDAEYLKTLADDKSARLEQTRLAVAALVTKLARDLPEAKVVRKLAGDLAKAEAALLPIQAEQAQTQDHLNAVLAAGKGDLQVADTKARFAYARLTAAKQTVTDLANQLNTAKAKYNAAFLAAYRAGVAAQQEENAVAQAACETAVAKALGKTAVALQTEKEAGELLREALTTYDGKRFGPEANIIAVPGRPVPSPLSK